MIPTVHRITAMTFAAALLLGAASRPVHARDADAPLPRRLSDTGLYTPGSSTHVDPKNLEFTPQYPLWSDGARKRRWIQLPPGSQIDAVHADAWEFPRGTRFWKEFSHTRRIETRFIERLPDGTWSFGTYLWNEDDSDALLAPSEGTTLARADAPGGKYAVPGELDCRACHEGAASNVLGFSALQLSSDRDPLAPHAELQTALDLEALVERGLIKNLPDSFIAQPPRIAGRTPVERAALGYLHGNCGHCHNDNGAPVPVDLVLAQRAASGTTGVERVLRSMLDAPSRFRGHGLAGDAPLIAAGDPGQSVLLARVRSRNPNSQMPPLGTTLRDAQAIALIERWIEEQPITPRRP